MSKAIIGCSGFLERLWKGTFYPEDLPSKDYLPYYSTKLDAVEVNSTFYRKPLLKTLENWYEKTGKDFKFFIKIPKTISHIKKLTDTKTETEEFCTHISSGLKEKMAGFLFQLPPSFHFSDENMKKLIDTVDKNYLNVVEFRHQSWWNEEVMTALKSQNIVFSGVSFPKDIPAEFVINNDETAYYRLHGVPVLFKSEYSEEEMQDLASKIKESDRKVYVFFNNTWGTAAVKNSVYLKEILEG